MVTCYRCGRVGCDRHHIFNGPMRNKSEEYGAVIPLCRECHSFVHNNAELRLQYKKEWQIKLMDENGWTEDEFREIFKRSYL